ncbi:phosphatidate cytidylyltransferase [Shimia sp. SDUM112013]|uniref:phosphatidate cytidylyltransferase n=1 Tax=Shimia sp. SDUM112013 TaxID=3136160 RepID=UPI0032EE231A
MIGLSVLQITLGGLIFLAIGYVLVGSVRLMPGKAALSKDLFEALLSMTLVAGSLFVVFLLGTWALVPALLALATRTGYEAAHVRLGPNKAGQGAVVGFLLSACAMLAPILATVLAGIWFLLLARFMLFPAPRTARVWHWVEVLLFPLIPVAILSWAALDPTLRPVVLITYILIETFDSYALVSGKLFGRTKAFPTLSPRKTIEGLAGGAVCLVLTLLLAAWVLDLPALAAIGAALLIGGVAVAGDLAASRLKRMAGVKDYPVVLPKQGGLLDILDSWIAAGAALAVVLFLVGT